MTLSNKPAPRIGNMMHAMVVMVAVVVVVIIDSAASYFGWGYKDLRVTDAQ